MKTNNKNQILSLHKISLRKNNDIVFSQTSWEILKNQQWVLLGSNGSGKSFLIMALLGKIPVVKGKIKYHFLNKIEAADKKFHARDHIEYVSMEKYETVLKKQGSFYQGRFNSIMDDESSFVSDFLTQGLSIKTSCLESSNIDTHLNLFKERQKQIVDLMNIEPLLQKKIIQLSNGEIRKIFIAKALLKNPNILILENPFMGMDRQYQVQLNGILDKLVQLKMTIIVLADTQKQIPDCITHMLFVEDNKVLEKGPIKQLIDKNTVKTFTKKAAPVWNPNILPEKKTLLTSTSLKPPTLVEMNHVNVTYGNHKILKDITWTIKQHEHWALSGPNGSGKSTLLSLIFADNPQGYANNIKLFGKKRGGGESIWQIKQKIGFVSPELHAYYPGNFKVFDVVCSGFFDSIGRFRSCTPDQKQIACQWLETFGLIEKQKVVFRTLSKGEQRITLLARALVKNPILLLLDEPCQNLDNSNIQRVQHVICKTAEELKTTLVYVTHVPDEIPDIITRELVLENGQIVRKRTKKSL